MIVVDIGCARYGGDYSIERLIEEFEPDVLYGFDPHPSVPEFEVSRTERDGREVILERKAAWIHDGEVGYLEDGLNSCVSHAGKPVPCFDLARFLWELPAQGGEIVLKIDAEGSEYDLLSHLIGQNADELLRLAWVEWHTAGIESAAERRAEIERVISCPIEEWRW